MIYTTDMTEREQKILQQIVENYVDTARPVGSKLLAQIDDFDYSPATIRNAMAELEKHGYIGQPHTSAGRVPTDKGYQFYLDHLMQPRDLTEKDFMELKTALQSDIRDLAKLLSEKTKLASIIYTHPESYYFTGLFNLFSQAEFEDYNMVLNMSQVVDSLEKSLGPLFKTADKMQILLGEENPVSKYCSVVVLPLHEQRQVLSILGPTRMDYAKTVGLLNGVNQILK